MQTRSKLVLLEFVGGLFGWLWIIASMAGLYFVVSAIAFNGRWANLFWAFGASVVAKWLARGFNDSQRRVAYEAELRSRGFSPEQAQEAWLSAYTRGASAAPSVGTPPEAAGDSERELLAAEELVNRYGAALGHSEATKHSELLLPAPKDEIKDALVAMARHVRHAGGSPDQIETLRVGYASLSDFVSAEEADAAAAFENLVDINPAGLDSAKLHELASTMAAASHDALNVTRRANDEFTRLLAEFDGRVRG